MRVVSRVSLGDLLIVAVDSSRSDRSRGRSSHPTIRHAILTTTARTLAAPRSSLLDRVSPESRCHRYEAWFLSPPPLEVPSIQEADSHGRLDGDGIQDPRRGRHVDHRALQPGISSADERAAGVPRPGRYGLTIIAIREPPDEILILWARIRIEYEHLGKPSRHHRSRRTTQSGLEGARRGGEEEDRGGWPNEDAEPEVRAGSRARGRLDAAEQV